MEWKHKLLSQQIKPHTLPIFSAHSQSNSSYSLFHPFPTTAVLNLRGFSMVSCNPDHLGFCLQYNLHLTAAFDTVDHSILLTRLWQIVGLQGCVLQWFRSYLTNRTGDLSSSSASLPSGVPQGSILGPVLFSLYKLPLGMFICTITSFHLYADDFQICLPVVPNSSDAFNSTHSCLHDIKLWLSQNCFCVNESKTECIMFGTSNVYGLITPALDSLLTHCSLAVK